MSYTERQLRELLSRNLSMIERGLELKEQESMLSWIDTNKKEIHAYIDILAVDENDNYVIIELKKSKQTSRAALHEIYKYIDGLVAKYSLRYDEIRAMIVSTEWEELSIAFSIARQHKGINLEGYYMAVSENGSLSIDSISKVRGLSSSIEREMAQFGLIFCYGNRRPLKEDIILRYKRRYEEAGINNYVMLLFQNQGDPQSDFTNALYVNNPYQDASLYETIIRDYNQGNALMTPEKIKEILDKEPEDINDSAISALFRGISPEAEESELGDKINLRYYLLNPNWRLINVITGKKMPNNHPFIFKVLEETAGSLLDILDKGDFKSPNKAALHRSVQIIRKDLAPVAIWRDAFVNELLDLENSDNEEQYYGEYHYQMRNSFIKSLGYYYSLRRQTELFMPHAYLEIGYDDRIITLVGGIKQNLRSSNSLEKIYEKYYPAYDYNSLRWIFERYSTTDSLIVKELGCSFYVVKAVEYMDEPNKNRYYFYEDYGYDEISKDLFRFTRSGVVLDDSLVNQVREIYAPSPESIFIGNPWLIGKKIYFANFDK